MNERREKKQTRKSVWSQWLHTLFLVCFFSLYACSPAPATDMHLASPLLGPYSFTPVGKQQRQGHVVFSSVGFPDAANPLFASSSSDFTLDTALWGQPIFYDQQFHAQPDQLTEVPLPENGDVQDDGKTISMHLRHDLRWSDGQPIVASDFRYWWQLDQDANTGATITRGYDEIASIDTPDNFTVVLHMKRAFGPYLFYLPYAAPQHAWGRLHSIDLQNTPDVLQTPHVTSGPYTIRTMHDGASYTLVPNSYYHSSTFHGPFVEQLIYQTYANTTALSTAARQQKTSVTMGYEEEDLPLLMHLPQSVQLRKQAAAAYEHLDFNNANPIFHDLAVRQAIQMSLDICGMVQTVLHDTPCTRQATQVEPLPSLFYDASIQPVPYNPERAKKLLAQAGWTTGTGGILSKQGRAFSLRLVTTAGSPLRAAVAGWIRQKLLALGIQVQIVYAPLSTFFGVYTSGGILATGAYDLALFSYANSPEPDDQYAVFHSSQIPDADHPDLGNYARISDTILDQALIQGRESIAFADRLAAYHRFLERLASQVYLIPLYTDVTIMTVDTHIQNVIPHPNQATTVWNISDWSASS